MSDPESASNDMAPLTGAELNLNLTRFQLLARQAELDYATAAGTLPAEFGVPRP